MSRAIHKFVFVIAAALTISSTALAGQKSHSKKRSPIKFDKWYETVGLDKFPCMNEKETSFLKQIVDRTVERKTLLSSHRKEVRPSSRAPASVKSNKINNHNFVCPPFKGVRNPYPEVVEFGKAAPFERIHVADTYVEVLNGKSKNEKWQMNFNNSKGYYEGQNPRGTPLNLIPLKPAKGEDVRFLVQYMVWKDGSAPALTICYREDLHNQCNPYMNPDLKPIEKPTPPGSAPGRLPASTAKPASPSKS
jgi:hypothetical protein